MNDEWKMPGTEQEENQQPVGEESEVTEATAVKEPEAGETAEAMPEATESQEPEVWERVEVSVGSSAGNRGEERTVGGCDGYSGTTTGTAGAAEWCTAGEFAGSSFLSLGKPGLSETPERSGRRGTCQPEYV